MTSRRAGAPIAVLAALALTLAACAGSEVVAADTDRAVQPPDAVEAQADSETDGALASLLADRLDEDVPAAVALIGDRDGAHLAASGVADLRDDTAVRTDDAFRIASVTKPMVAAALLSYVEDGEIGLDDRIADHLSADVLAGLANTDRATVRQLLQMTSGIPDYLDTDAFWAAVERTPTTFWLPEQVLAFADGIPAEHAPGTAFHYSNSNYILAQLILEDLSGRSLAEVLDWTVFGPAGMDDCAVETAATFATAIVRGYDLDDDGELADVTEVNDGVGLGDGGVICSVESMARFLPALLDGAILEQETVQVMLDTDGSTSQGAYGLGIDVDRDGAFGVTVGHEGASSGFQATLLYLPADDLSVAVLTNSMASDAHRDVADDLLGWWYDSR